MAVPAGFIEVHSLYTPGVAYAINVDHIVSVEVVGSEGENATGITLSNLSQAGQGMAGVVESYPEVMAAVTAARA